MSGSLSPTRLRAVARFGTRLRALGMAGHPCQVSRRVVGSVSISCASHCLSRGSHRNGVWADLWCTKRANGLAEGRLQIACSAIRVITSATEHNGNADSPQEQRAGIADNTSPHDRSDQHGPLLHFGADPCPPCLIVHRHQCHSRLPGDVHDH